MKCDQSNCDHLDDLRRRIAHQLSPGAWWEEVGRYDAQRAKYLDDADVFVKIVRQVLDLDCGEASLATVAAGDYDHGRQCPECGADVCHPPPRACCSCGHGLLLNDQFGKGSAALCPRAQLHGTGPINCQACDWTMEGDG